jgi:hypothetical protein
MFCGLFYCSSFVCFFSLEHLLSAFSTDDSESRSRKRKRGKAATSELGCANVNLVVKLIELFRQDLNICFWVVL